MMSVNERATEVARSSYGRLLALLSARSGDVIAAEDALADAFSRALERWPESGIPDNPEAWLFTVARNRLRDGARMATRHAVVDDEIEQYADMTIRNDTVPVPDERLKLMFVCAHPAIDPSIHTPLMLQTVLGIEASVIAKAYVLSATNMAQRLVRAKRKIKDAAIPFVYPETKDLPERLDSVLEAVYGAYAVEWIVDAETDVTAELETEAVFLATLIADLMPDQAEALGLAALLLFSHARRDARSSDTGEFIALDAQDTARWDTAMISHAERLLSNARALGQIGRFQLEAAIQSAHCDRRQTGSTNWMAVAALYEGLVQLAPTVGAAVGRAAAVGHAVSPQAGLQMLALIEPDAIANFQPAWATRAWLHGEAGEFDHAVEAFDRAIDLTTRSSVRNHLEQRRDALRHD